MNNELESINKVQKVRASGSFVRKKELRSILNIQTYEQYRREIQLIKIDKAFAEEYAKFENRGVCSIPCHLAIVILKHVLGEKITIEFVRKR